MNTGTKGCGHLSGVWPLLWRQVGQAWGMRLEGLLGADGNEIQGSDQGD